jgi:iron-sulfur cluster repair protein YtfE (RIC family)
MDPFELLKKDHETVAKLFDRIEAASGKRKLGVFQQIKSELEVHTHIEETIFYPAIEKAHETRALTLEAYEEHKVVKELLSELDAAGSVSDEWEAKLKVLRENVEHHVDEEENELFDKANDVLTGEEAERLGDRMAAEKVRQGGSVPEPEKPGLLQKIANTLGLGASTQPSPKTTTKKKGSKARAGKTAATRAPSARAGKRRAGTTAKSKRPKGTKPASGAPPKKDAPKKKTTKKAVSKRKKVAVKQTRRGR